MIDVRAGEGRGAAAGSVEDVYERLRAAIMDGTIPAGAIVNQVSLAQSLGVSRTPLREALRMLQAQGFVEAEHQHRMRVSALEPEAIDAIYATRIMLESLGVALTVPRLTRAALDELRSMLGTISALEPDPGDAEFAAWEGTHRAFHQLQVSCADAALRDAITANMDKAGRYRQAFVRSVPSTLRADEDHRAIVDAFVARNVDKAVYFVSRHLAHTAIGLLAWVAPQVEPVGVRQALRLTAGTSPANLESFAARKARAS
jgi:DNA-binding GntR family transcriptional regulator